MLGQPVISSNLASVAYSPWSATLVITFRNGRVYEYRGVPAAIHARLMSASSHGCFFAANIRHRYPYRRIG